METMIDIPVIKTKHSTIGEVDWNNLVFGQHVSDHMFIATYKDGEWQDPQIIPYQNISLPPTALALHYGQSVFEGMKAFRTVDGGINIFRMERHFDRLNRSMDRMCMPQLPFDLFEAALRQLVQVDAEWVPAGEDVALYLRPIVFASEGKMGVKVSDEYTFMVLTGPVPTLYQNPIKVKVEREYIRAAKGGTGYAKCAGNYGGAFYPTQIARKEGFDQVLWTDAFEHEYIEESGTMNLMFVLDGKLVTAPVSDSILDGVTRDSLLELAESLGIKTEERRISVTELVSAIESGKKIEAFGAGTAAVVAPIQTIGVDGELYNIPAYDASSVMYCLKRELEAIRTGAKEDGFGWNVIL
ncbi:MAG TPA: branched-chain amino acid aminotransferase [Flavisolibacter sp.]|nr:branched-chain amino acid aminotransferase [Flavisolibacter sp.]